MKNIKFIKVVVLAIIFLFVGAGILPTLGGTVIEKTSSTAIGSNGYIQDLIDNASAGETIYIPGGIYYENIVINKSISLIGEDKDNTIIDGNGNGYVVYIIADWVNISRFTIRNGRFAGIKILNTDYNTITENIISDNNNGIILEVGNFYNKIIDNTITSNNGTDLSLGSSHHNIIKNNTMSSNNGCGISLHLSKSNTIIGNTISNKKYGIYLGGSSNNNISGNTLSKNTYGIYLRFYRIFGGFQPSQKNNILRNNFLGYRQHMFCGGDCSNKWNENYWNRPRSLPKIIIGLFFIDFFGILHRPIVIPGFNIDRHPAEELYDIGG